MTPITSAYYLAWRTWKEEPTQTPWDFWLLKQGSEFRRRAGSTSRLVPDSLTLQAAFDAQNAALLDEIEREFVADMHLVAFVEADSEESAQGQVLKLFEDAEFSRTAFVDPATRIQILELLTQPGKERAGS